MADLEAGAVFPLGELLGYQAEGIASRVLLKRATGSVTLTRT